VNGALTLVDAGQWAAILHYGTGEKAMSRFAAAKAAMTMMGIMLAPVCDAATLQTLHSFQGTPDGAIPSGSLTLLNGSIYGTTAGGGVNFGRDNEQSTGTVYGIDLSTNVETVLQRFAVQGAGKHDGINPYIGLITDGTTLYGATGDTPKNRSYKGGVVFSINPVTDALTAFSKKATKHGVSSLLLSDNTLYGTSGSGGKDGFGSVFAASPPDVKTRRVASFKALPSAHFPSGGLVSIDGILYGETNYGGLHDFGALYQLNLATNKISLLYSFTDGADGARPVGPMAVNDTTIYGATTTGGGGYKQGCPDGCGTVFSFDTSNGTFVLLHTFVVSDGAFPLGGVTVDNGTLYGTTSAGGSPTALAGTVFEINLSTGAFTSLYNFAGAGDGGEPRGAVLISGGKIYGTASSGGSHDSGTVFSFTP
jgi:uncharacterized repeat protein (TIGR03803 family)